MFDHNVSPTPPPITSSPPPPPHTHTNFSHPVVVVVVVVEEGIITCPPTPPPITSSPHTNFSHPVEVEEEEGKEGSASEGLSSRYSHSSLGADPRGPASDPPHGSPPQTLSVLTPPAPQSLRCPTWPGQQSSPLPLQYKPSGTPISRQRRIEGIISSSPPTTPTSSPQPPRWLAT